VIVIDSDVPWIPTKNKATKDATIYYIDADPLKEDMPLWYIPSKAFYKADSLTALKQINKALKRRRNFNEVLITDRREKVTAYHKELKKEIEDAEQMNPDFITPEFLTACVREITDDNTIVLNETITSYGIVNKH